MADEVVHHPVDKSAESTETTDRGLFDFLGAKKKDGDKPGAADYQHKEELLTEFEEKVHVSKPEPKYDESKVEEEKEKKPSLLDKLHRSGSSSCSSSSDEEEGKVGRKNRMEKKGGEVVCVTGGSGFIGSWLVRLLLDRGYTVHATVKNLNDEKETKHLQALVQGTDEQSRLRLFQIDLLDYDSIVAAVNGTTGVFHLASPCIVDKVLDPEKELLAPAIKGTINVLTAAKELGVRRVVLTSSVSAIVPSRYWPAHVVKSEDCWTDVEYCKQNELWYPTSKTLAEKAAWEFAKEKGLDVVVVNPGTVMGPVLPPTINASMLMILRLLQGCTEIYEDFFMGSVHVKDVALAHVLVYENTSATGRHMCVEAISHYGDFAAKVAQLYPEYQLPRLPRDTQPGLLRSKNASKKLMDLGLQFTSMEQIIRDSVESLRSKGFI